MMRRITEAELAREPARALADPRGESVEAIAAELLLRVARERLDEPACRALERSFWRALAARKTRT
ncbi:MAG TPA: hypothetical protein VFX59_02085 [Polyangiales bacterium]|nr:hypothetical protein [Polyangiales bacterium]